MQCPSLAQKQIDFEEKLENERYIFEKNKKKFNNSMKII
jgi:hypothetical protein